MTAEDYPIFWNGPHDFPQLRCPSPLDEISGVYMWTVLGPSGYVCSGCGITERPIRKRMLEHRRGYLSGAYTMLDINEMRKGNRKEIWHGMWAGYDSPERKAEFLERKDELQAVAEDQMDSLQIFVAEEQDKRIQERVEAAIVSTLYEAKPPYCDLPDRGTLRMPRREDEQPLVFINQSNHHFVNLADRMVS